MNKILFTILDEENLQRKNPKCNSITSKSGHTRSRLGNCSRSCSRSRLYTSRTNGICINHLCELQTHIHSRKSILPPNTCTSLKLPILRMALMSSLCLSLSLLPAICNKMFNAYTSNDSNVVQIYLQILLYS